MSDFSDVEFFDNLEEQSTGTPVAPEGEYNAKIIATDKYKSAAGNWTLKVTFQIAGVSIVTIMNGITYGLLTRITSV